MTLFLALIIAWIAGTLGFVFGCFWYTLIGDQPKDEELDDLLDRFDAELRGN